MSILISLIPVAANGVSGVIAATGLVVVVVIGAAITIREKLIDAGVSRPRWLLRTSQRAAVRRLTHDAAFLESEFLEHLGNATDVAVARRKLPDEMLKHPDRELITALKDWTIKLDRGVDFHGLHHYVNTMGAISASEDNAAKFAAIAHAWLTVLQSRNAIPPFDCLLSIKDGNPILVHGLAQRLRRSENRPVRAVFCKGEQDSAKVSPGLHETDFEGLRAFRDEKPIPRCHNRLRALAVDDNCTTGRSLFEGIQRFNRFVVDHPDEYPFAPVDTAVVLFIVKTTASNAFANSDGIRLHALLALGDEEMGNICTDRLSTLKGKAVNFKDSSACSWSRALDAP